MAALRRGARAVVVILSFGLALGIGLGACGRSSGEPAAGPPSVAPDEPDASTPPTEDVVAAAPGGLDEEVRAASSMPAPPPADKRLRLIEHSGDSNGPIGYQVIEPDDADGATPLVIALHGMGDTPDGFSRFVKRLALRARVFVARGPEPWGSVGGRQWYVNEADDAIKQLRVRARELSELAAKIRALHPDAGKPALVGFSQGAAVALQATLEYPDSWRAVVALSGFIASEGGAKTPSAPVPVLVVAGSEDTIVPTKLSWYAAGALVRYGHTDVRKLEFNGPHQIPREVVDAVRVFFAEVLAGG